MYSCALPELMCSSALPELMCSCALPELVCPVPLPRAGGGESQFRCLEGRGDVCIGRVHYGGLLVAPGQEEHHPHQGHRAAHRQAQPKN